MRTSHLNEFCALTVQSSDSPRKKLLTTAEDFVLYQWPCLQFCRGKWKMTAICVMRRRDCKRVCGFCC